MSSSGQIFFATFTHQSSQSLFLNCSGTPVHWSGLRLQYYVLPAESCCCSYLQRSCWMQRKDCARSSKAVPSAYWTLMKEYVIFKLSSERYKLPALKKKQKTKQCFAPMRQRSVLALRQTGDLAHAGCTLHITHCLHLTPQVTTITTELNRCYVVTFYQQHTVWCHKNTVAPLLFNIVQSVKKKKKERNCLRSFLICLCSRLHNTFMPFQQCLQMFFST